MDGEICWLLSYLFYPNERKINRSVYIHRFERKLVRQIRHFDCQAPDRPMKWTIMYSKKNSNIWKWFIIITHSGTDNHTTQFYRFMSMSSVFYWWPFSFWYGLPFGKISLKRRNRYSSQKVTFSSTVNLKEKKNCQYVFDFLWTRRRIKKMSQMIYKHKHVICWHVLELY